MPQNKSKVAIAIINLLSVVLLNETRNFNIKPNATPIAKQMIVFNNGQIISIGDKEPLPEIAINTEIETVYRSTAITPSRTITCNNVFTY